MESRLTTIKSITQFIFIQNKPKKSDLIIVPGSSQFYLPRKASYLYLKGFAKKIIFTGGINRRINKSESEFGKEIAVNLNIPKKDIYCENISSNTKENAIEALNLAKHYKIKHNKIILVSKPYHSRRLLMTFKAIFPQSKFVVIPVEDDRKINRKNWWKNTKKIEKVMEEIGKISEYFLKGDLSIK